jgi:hypothetical protein
MHGPTITAVLGIINLEETSIVTDDECVSEPMPDYLTDHAQFNH